MGKPRTPTKVLEMRGAYRKHPERRAQRENEPVDLPDIEGPPSYLTTDQLECWHTIVEKCADGVLKQSDEVALEIAARLFAEMRAGTIDRPGLKQLDTLLGKFGMNPSERSKVSVSKSKPSNKFTAIG